MLGWWQKNAWWHVNRFMWDFQPLIWCWWPIEWRYNFLYFNWTTCHQHLFVTSIATSIGHHNDATNMATVILVTLRWWWQNHCWQMSHIWMFFHSTLLMNEFTAPVTGNFYIRMDQKWRHNWVIWILYSSFLFILKWIEEINCFPRLVRWPEVQVENFMVHWFDFCVNFK